MSLALQAAGTPLRNLFLLALLGALTGCYSYRVASAPLIVDQRVRICYALPQEVTVVQGADSTAAPGTREAVGRLQSQRNDSLWLLLVTTNDVKDVLHRWPRGAISAAQLRTGTTVESRGFDKAKTRGVIIGGMLVATWFAFGSAYGESSP
jgi:hypothetical protein